MDQPRICVVGAGCSGITAVKNLLQVGLRNIVCYEQGEQIGGNWVYTSHVSHSSVCETTHIISSKKLSAYLDFPMPEHYPDYPSHRQVLSYFESYCMHFDLYPYIQFNRKVEGVDALPDHRWRVRLSDGDVHDFDYVLVANGHHSVPQHPDFRTDFKGWYLHAHAFKHARDFAEKRVLVVGGGNSACDCAVEISRVADFVAISMRTPQYIIPKFFMGRPSDSFNKQLLSLPAFLAKFIRKASLRLQVGDYRSYGLEKPEHDVLEAHPTMNSELLYQIRHGKVHPRRGIAHIEGTTIRFHDGTAESFDVLVAATGYQITFPFLDAHSIPITADGYFELYLRMFHPSHPSLIFIGLVQPQGAIWPLSDRQSKLAANYITGRWAMPENVAALARSEAQDIQKAFLPRARHRLEVHYHPFARKLDRQIPKDAPSWSVR